MDPGGGGGSPIFSAGNCLNFFLSAENTTLPAQIIMEPPAKRSRKLLEDDSSSDSENDSGGVSLGDSGAGFKINEDYARRFEHNKRREELQQRT